MISRWVHESPGQTLLAFDAPLGWPIDLGTVLSRHSAGERLGVDANLMFRRKTDRTIADRFRKTPLDVGADRIARTAHWALDLLNTLRNEFKESVPLAWSPRFTERVAAIEVYPAATLLAHGIAIRGYKTKDNVAARAGVHELVTTRLRAGPEEDRTNWSIDTLDAVVCVIAGIDFASGLAVAPVDADVAAKEGWIWAAEAVSETRVLTSG